MLSETEKQELKAALIEERDRLEKELDSFTREFASVPGGHEAFIETHQQESNPEDEAQTVEEYQKRKALENVLEKRLEELTRALEVIDTDQFGVCVKCGQKIAPERMKVNPAASSCFKCAS